MKKFGVALCIFFGSLLSCFAYADEGIAPIPFDQAIAEILGRSTRIAQQEANLKSVRAGNLPEKLFLLPTLEIDAQQGKGETGGFSTQGQQIQGVSKLNLFRFGADFFAWRAANSEEMRQEALLESEVLGAENDAIKALVTELSSLKQVEVLKKIVGIQETSLKTATERYRRGLLPLQETEKLLIDLENSKSRLIDAELREYEARSNLSALLGHANISLEWPWLDRFRGNQIQGLFKAQFVLQEQPDFRSAEARVEAEDQRYKQRRSEILPSLDASLSYGRSSGLFGGGANGSTGWTGILALTIPIFDRMNDFSRTRSQSFIREVAEVSLEQVRRSANSEFDAARKSLSSSLASAISREKTLQLSGKLHTDSLTRFQSGRISANEFAVDQSRLFDSELFVIRGWETAHLAYARYCHSLGRRVFSCVR